MRKKYGQVLIGGAIGLLCLWLAFRNNDWGAMAAAFRSADYRYVPLYVGIHLLAMLLRGLRWRSILSAIRPVSLKSVTAAEAVGFMGNMIFPARAGEFIRAYIIGVKERIGTTSTFATIVLERLFDGLTIVSFLLLVPFLMRVPADKERVLAGVKAAGMASFAVYLVLLVVLFLLHHRRETFLRVTDALCRRLPERFGAKLAGVIASFGRGLDILGSPAQVVAALGLSLGIWTIQALANWLIIRSFGIDLPVYAGFFLIVVQAFAAMAPSPGFVGTMEYAQVLGLSFFGVSKELALSSAILTHGLLFATYIGMGLVGLTVEGLHLSEVREGEEMSP